MTIKFNDIYINETATVTGPYEAKGPIGKYFDFSYDDLYFGAKTWEQAESKAINKAIDILLKKSSLEEKNITTFIGGDLLNQITASNYAMKEYGASFIGIYAACATSTLGLFLAAIFAQENNQVIAFTSSHNNGAEKQFRYPVEYGGPKPKTTTFTSTGAVAALITKVKKGVKIESGTIGRVVDAKIKDAYNMGAVMAKAAADTIYNHLKDTNRQVDYYDLILTGDLGIYGKKILKDYMLEEYNINLENYNDTGTILYDLKHQPVYAGASGPACAPLVTYSYIFNEMKKNKIKKVLLVATGALLSTTSVNQKLSIPAIAHAISLEALL